jgi:surfeit locus 1 family protein
VNPRIKLLMMAVATVVAVGVTASLGQWQLGRAHEKQALQKAMDLQSVKSPLSAQTLLAATRPSDLIHQRASLRGEWVPAATVYLENRPMSGLAGFYVLTPLKLEGTDKSIVVQRGWAPRNFSAREQLPQLDTPKGLVEIDGRIAPPPSRLYQPGTAQSGLIRQNVGLVEFEAEIGMPLMAVTLREDGKASQGLLRDWPAVNLGFEKNQGYALQWFGMSGLFALLFIWFQVIRRFFYRPKDSIRHD